MNPQNVLVWVLAKLYWSNTFNWCHRKDFLFKCYTFCIKESLTVLTFKEKMKYPTHELSQNCEGSYIPCIWLWTSAGRWVIVHCPNMSPQKQCLERSFCRCSKTWLIETTCSPDRRFRIKPVKQCGLEYHFMILPDSRLSATILDTIFCISEYIMII